MKLSIFAVGRLKKGIEQQLCQRYLDRIATASKQQGLAAPMVREFPESRARDAETRKSQEAESLLSSVPERTAIVLLDEQGKNLDSEGFARLITDFRDNGTPELCFVIGGADGTSQRLKDSAAASVSFGKLTWPHMLVRIMLAEQIYRAVTILNGHPYHRS